MKTFLNCLIASVIGCLGGGILIPLFWEFQAGNADIIASLGTWFGSIGTIGTLVFLIRQNIQIKRQQNRSNYDEEKRMDMMLFQKYQMHRNEFDKLLDQLEEKHKKSQLNFCNRHQLYKNIFPENNFNKTEFHAPKFMASAHTQLDILNRHLNCDDYTSDSIEQLIQNFGWLFNTLHIRFSLEFTYGDVIYLGEGTDLNVLEPNNKLDTLKDVFSLLCIFVLYENKIEKMGRVKNTHAHLIWEHCRRDQTYYDVSMRGELALFQDLFKADQLLKDRTPYGFGKRIKPFSINQPVLPCEVYLDLFTIDNLSKLEYDMEFKVMIIDNFIRYLNSDLKKSQNDLNKNKLLQTITSLKCHLP